MLYIPRCSIDPLPSDHDSSPQFRPSEGPILSTNGTTTDSTNTDHCEVDHILSVSQRHILSNIFVTILSNSKPKKIPRSTKGMSTTGFSSESDHGGNDREGPMDRIKEEQRNINDSDHLDDDAHPTEGVMDGDHHHLTRPDLIGRDSNGSSPSPEPDFVDKALSPLKDRHYGTSGDHREDRQTLAKIVSTQREKLVLMNSILKYIESRSEMDTIHRACFNLWKDWYRCYGSITNQFQQAFMAVCETLLGNVDSRALARDPPECGVNDTGSKSVEQITFDLSTQISHLKHAFAIEQLHTSSAGSDGGDAQNVAQVWFHLF